MKLNLKYHLVKVVLLSTNQSKSIKKVLTLVMFRSVHNLKSIYLMAIEIATTMQTRIQALANILS